MLIFILVVDFLNDLSNIIILKRYKIKNIITEMDKLKTFFLSTTNQLFHTLTNQFYNKNLDKYILISKLHFNIFEDMILFINIISNLIIFSLFEVGMYIYNLYNLLINYLSLFNFSHSMFSLENYFQNKELIIKNLYSSKCSS